MNIASWTWQVWLVHLYCRRHTCNIQIGILKYPFKLQCKKKVTIINAHTSCLRKKKTSCKYWYWQFSWSTNTASALRRKKNLQETENHIKQMVKNAHCKRFQSKPKRDLVCTLQSTASPSWDVHAFPTLPMTKQYIQTVVIIFDCKQKLMLYFRQHCTSGFIKHAIQELIAIAQQLKKNPLYPINLDQNHKPTTLKTKSFQQLAIKV